MPKTLADARPPLSGAELVAALRRWAGELGPEISLRAFCRRVGVAPSFVYRHFDSWGELREAAGLPRFVDRSGCRAEHSRESLLELLQGVIDEVGEGVTLTEFRRATGLSTTPIVRLFGSWWAFREAAGLPREGRSRQKTSYTRSELLELLDQVVKQHGRQITLQQFCEATGVSQSTIERVGSWTRLRRELGLPRRGSRRKLVVEDPAQEELVNPRLLLGFADELGEPHP